MHLLAPLLVASASFAFTSAQTIQQSTQPVPLGYSYIGCYTDSAATRGLTGAYQNNVDGNTALDCAAFCGTTIYFGLEFASQCFCGDVLGPTSVKTADSNCQDPNYTCPGYPNTYYCGGSNYFAVYQVNPVAAVPPVTTTVTATLIQSSTCAASTVTVTAAPSMTTAVNGKPPKTKTKDKNDGNGGGN